VIALVVVDLAAELLIEAQTLAGTEQGSKQQAVADLVLVGNIAVIWLVVLVTTALALVDVQLQLLSKPPILVALGDDSTL